VVGLAQNVKWQSPSAPPAPFLYIPLLQNYYPEVTLYVRVAGEPRVFSALLEKTVQEMNPELPLFDITNLEKRTQVAGFLGRLAAALVGVYGFLALLLAAIGIYGVLAAYATRQRTREIGIRMALGAQAGTILRLVLRHGLTLTLVGLILGTSVSLSLTGFLRSQLFGVAPTDWLTFGGVAAMLCFVALFACYLPARRAAKVDPMVALRAE
jgi:ABC-type antimicrobial peptide transport system permease subunit